MSYWIFQGRREDFDIDTYLANYPLIYWTVRYEKHRSEMQVGDGVFIWRSKGKQNGAYGLVAVGSIVERPMRRDSVKHPEALMSEGWHKEEDETSEYKVGIKLDETRLTVAQGMVEASAVKQDDDLKEMSIIKVRTGTNFKISHSHHQKLMELWRDTKKEDTAFVFPPLDRSARHREYDEHSLAVRSEVVKAYLFDGLSHRSLDEKVIGVDPAYSRGYQSMGILHYLGLVDAHKGIFAGMSKKAAVQNLEDLNDPDLDEVLEHLRYKPTKPYTAPTPSIDLQKLNQEHEKAVRKSLDDDDGKRKERLKKANDTPDQVQVTTTAYKRNADVVAEVLKRANGICEKCNSPAPFNKAKDGTPYLEVHHWIHLSKGGKDRVENAGALCPNCHREEHFG